MNSSHLTNSNIRSCKNYTEVTRGKIDARVHLMHGLISLKPFINWPRESNGPTHQIRATHQMDPCILLDPHTKLGPFIKLDHTVHWAMHHIVIQDLANQVHRM